VSETATAPQTGTTPTPQAPPEPDSPETEKSSEREYHLFKVVQPDVFQRVSTVVATSPANALKTLGEKVLLETEHVACTGRSWFAPGKPKIKTNTTISFGE
jgi:hypothetical protein